MRAGRPKGTDRPCYICAMRSVWLWLLIAIIFVAGCGFALHTLDLFGTENSTIDVDKIFGDEDPAPAAPLPVTPQEVAAQPQDHSALGGYNVLIADRGNNRVIEVTPEKRIVWEYDFKGLPPGYGADDAFFADGGKTVVMSLEFYHVIETIDYATKKITWQYGTPGTHGSGTGYLYRPDDAYKLPNGDITVADIQNCRILQISPSKKIVRQYGKTRQCSNVPGHLDGPNGDTPLPNGSTLVSTILDHSVVELDQAWNPIFSLQLPIKYPSDPQLTKAGNILVASYQNPGKIIEISRQGNVLWEFDGEGTTTLNKPSLAVELPNGNIISNDDYNHRVIVIDKNTKQIVWQYGVTGKPGDGNFQLNTPDGLDFIKRDLSASASSTPLQPPTIGSVTRHPEQYIGASMQLRGYLLEMNGGIAIFSDEAGGAVSSFDLPVVGSGVQDLMLNRPYTLVGTFTSGNPAAQNGSTYRLELSMPPMPSN
jgi:hypothetical protein